MTSEDIMAASLNIIGGQGSLKKQKFVQKLLEKAIENQRCYVPTQGESTFVYGEFCLQISV